MVTIEKIKHWIINDEIIKHIDELIDMDFTPEIIGMLSMVNFSISDLPNSLLFKIKTLNDNLIKRNNRIVCEEMQDKKQKVIEDNGEINIRLIRSETPEINNKHFNRNIAMCYHKLGDDVNAYKFFTIAHEQGVDCLDYLEYYNSLFAEQNFQKISDIVTEARNIYNSEKKNKIEKVQEYAYGVIDKYIYYLQGEIDKGTETNLKDALANYLIDNVIDKNIDNCSTYTYLLSSGIEGLLKTFYYKPYVIHLEEEFKRTPDDEIIQHAYDRMTKKIVKTKNLFDFHFTLGTFYNMAGLDHFLHWVQKNHNENLTRIELDKFRDEIDRIITLWRNPVAHAVYIEEWKFKYLLNEVLLKDNCLLSKIIKNVSYAEYDEEQESEFDFDKFIDQLEIFVARSGRYPRLNSQYKDEADLARIVYEIRLSKKGFGQVHLNKTIINKLNKINFQWVSRQDIWFDDFFNKLLQYKNKHKGFNGVENDAEIGCCVQSIRRKYSGIVASSLIKRLIDKKLVLTNEHIKQLEMIGFNFTKDSEKDQKDSCLLNDQA